MPVYDSKGYLGVLGGITQRKRISDGRPQLSYTKAPSNGTAPRSNDESTSPVDGIGQVDWSSFSSSLI